MFDLFDAKSSQDSDEKMLAAFTVSEINAVISDVLSSSLPSVIYVEGELSNFSLASSGHRYFSLIDKQAQISCALFKGSARFVDQDFLHTLESGVKVTVKASLSVYQPRGSYQLIVQSIEPAGFGDAAKAYAMLKNKLDKQGFTKDENKQKIANWPKGIAIVSSKTGAAIQDVISTLKRRAPFIPVFVFSSQVQGADAPQSIVKALQKANQCDEVDTLLLVRGGGSSEDLSAFNTESVAMAVVNSGLPVISGVGHETDFTIVDFVSDYRAATPTAAAEKSSPDKSQLSLILEEKYKKLVAYQSHQQFKYSEYLKHLSVLLSKRHPQLKLAMQSQYLDQLAQQLESKIKLVYRQKIIQTEYFSRYLSSLNPISQLTNQQNHLDILKKRLLGTSPFYLMSTHQAKLSFIKRQLNNKINQMSVLKKQQLIHFSYQLKSLSPLSVLDRGYAVLTDEKNQVLSQTNQTFIDQSITVRLSDGELQANITAINKITKLE